MMSDERFTTIMRKIESRLQGIWNCDEGEEEKVIRLLREMGDLCYRAATKLEGGHYE